MNLLINIISNEQVKKRNFAKSDNFSFTVPLISMKIAAVFFRCKFSRLQYAVFRAKKKKSFLKWAIKRMTFKEFLTVQIVEIQEFTAKKLQFEDRLWHFQSEENLPNSQIDLKSLLALRSLLKMFECF